MSIMIGIDETLADHAARIGTRHYDDDNNSCGARAPCALPCGSEAFMLFIACARKKMDSAIVSRSSERRDDGLRGSIQTFLLKVPASTVRQYVRALCLWIRIWRAGGVQP